MLGVLKGMDPRHKGGDDGQWKGQLGAVFWQQSPFG
jgi:hypothetical protein